MRSVLSWVTVWDIATRVVQNLVLHWNMWTARHCTYISEKRNAEEGDSIAKPSVWMYKLLSRRNCFAWEECCLNVLVLSQLSRLQKVLSVSADVQYTCSWCVMLVRCLVSCHSRLKLLFHMDTDAQADILGLYLTEKGTSWCRNISDESSAV